jgi:hypothetical protein
MISCTDTFSLEDIEISNQNLVLDENLFDIGIILELANLVNFKRLQGWHYEESILISRHVKYGRFKFWLKEFSIFHTALGKIHLLSFTYNNLLSRL